MVARPRLAATFAAGSITTLVTLGALTMGAQPAHPDTVCPTTLLPGQLCTVVDTVVTLVPTTLAPTPTTSPTTTPTTQPTTATTSPPTTSAPTTTIVSPTSPLPEPELPLLPGLPLPVPSPSSPPSNDGTAPAPSTSPGAGDASPTSHPAATTSPAGGGASTSAAGSSTVAAAELARGLDLPAANVPVGSGSPFDLGPAPLPSAATPNGSNLLAAPLPAAKDAGSHRPSLPRPTAPITFAVLLVAGVLGWHGVRWIDRQTATATVPFDRDRLP